jgi:hypothetical protein
MSALLELGKNRTDGSNSLGANAGIAAILLCLSVSAIKLFVGFGVDDHLIRELMRFIEMTCREFKKKRMMYRLEDSPNRYDGYLDS